MKNVLNTTLFNVLSIAGSDSSGGAGIQADLKTFSAHGVFGMSVVTAITAQNTQGVWGVADILPEMVAKQIEAVFEDILVSAVKIGMVSNAQTIKTIAALLSRYQAENIVLDPVMVSKSGCSLLERKAAKTLVEELLPLATIVTPNIPEAEVIAGFTIKNIKDMEAAARLIHSFGPKNVLLKGGHLEGDATDLLFDGRDIRLFSSGRLPNKNTHGTGCTLSSAIASNLAKNFPIADCITNAKEYITTAIKHGFPLGKGIGPVHHFYSLYKKAGLI